MISSKKQQKTILLVEDDALIATTETHELQKKGYQVNHVFTGQDAIQTALNENSNIDLILMDINLGSGIDGTETASKILKQKDIPVVFLSSHTESEIVEKTEKITSYGYVVKNSGIVVLDASIKMALKLFKANHDLLESKEKLKESERKTLAWLENSPVCTKIVNADFKLHYMSPAGVESLGFKSLKDIQNTPYPFNFYPESFRIKMRQKMEQAKSTGKISINEASVVDINGNEIWFHSTIVPVFCKKKELDYYLVVSINTTERKQTEKAFEQQLQEKEILLKEVYHRIKNNISSIISLLRMQVGSISNKDAIEILSDAIGRAESIREIYNIILNSSQYEEMSVKDYFNALINSIIQLFPEGKTIKTKINIQDFILHNKNIFSLGVIVNECLSNSIKYAFLQKKKGHIKVSLTKKENTVSLVVQDNGIGLPEAFDLDMSNGFGLKLVGMFTQQLNGTFSIRTDKGTKCTVSFKI